MTTNTLPVDYQPDYIIVGCVSFPLPLVIIR
jgi:hypothetical protein